MALALGRGPTPRTDRLRRQPASLPEDHNTKDTVPDTPACLPTNILDLLGFPMSADFLAFAGRAVVLHEVFTEANTFGDNWKVLVLHQIHEELRDANTRLQIVLDRQEQDRELHVESHQILIALGIRAGILAPPDQPMVLPASNLPQAAILAMRKKAH